MVFASALGYNTPIVSQQEKRASGERKEREGNALVLPANRVYNPVRLLSTIITVPSANFSQIKTELLEHADLVVLKQTHLLRRLSLREDVDELTLDDLGDGDEARDG